MGINHEIDEDVPFSKSEAEETYDVIHSLIADVDSSAGLLVGGDASVKAKVQASEEEVNERVIRGIEATEETLSELSVEDIEEISDLFHDCLTGENKKSELIKKTDSVADVIEDAEKQFREEVVNNVENTAETNVGYAHSYLQNMVQQLETITQDFRLLP